TPGHHPALHSFPTRRSSDLVRCSAGRGAGWRVARRTAPQGARPRTPRRARTRVMTVILAAAVLLGVGFLLVSAVLRRIRAGPLRSEEHTSELQSLRHLVCRL